MHSWRLHKTDSQYKDGSMAPSQDGSEDQVAGEVVIAGTAAAAASNAPAPAAAGTGGVDMAVEGLGAEVDGELRDVEENHAGCRRGRQRPRVQSNYTVSELKHMMESIPEHLPISGMHWNLVAA